MSTASRLAARLFLLTLLTTVTHTSLRAQERAPENRPAPIVTATVSNERVRFIAPSDTTNVRLEVYTVDGQRLFDSGFKSGSFLDWTMLDEQGQRRAAGTYLCVVAVKSLSGHVSHKLGTLNLSAEGAASLEPLKATGLNAAQLQALDLAENSSALTVLREGEAIATTSIASTDRDGAITRGQGALLFRVGDFYGGKDKEQMRLTEEGNLGVGTDDPQAKLDVNGVIRARGGIRFEDGSVLTSAADVSSTKTIGTSTTPPTSIASGSTGTINRISKWTDSSGTLGDSGINEVGGKVGIGTSTPTYKVVIGNDLGTGLVAADLTISRGAGKSVSTYVGPSGAQGIEFGWDQTNVRGFVNAPAGTPFTFTQEGAERIRIHSNGFVGMGTLAPTDRLEVVGNVRVSGAGNGIIFADGSKMTTAPGGAGSIPSGTSLIGAINDPSTADTINDNRLSANLARLNSANTFNGNQTVNGNFNVSGNAPAGGRLSANTVEATEGFISGNSYILRLTGKANILDGVSIGRWAGGYGEGNTYIGYEAGTLDDSRDNTFVGKNAGYVLSPRGSVGNTLLGADTRIASYISNATAIGSGAAVEQSNSLVLGNGVNVGIGTTAPKSKLDIIDPGNTGLRVQTNSGGGTVASFGGKGEFQIDSPGNPGGRLKVRENGTVVLGDCPGCYPANDRLIVGGTVSLFSLGSGGSTSLCQNSSHQISTCSSSVRYKTNIADFSSGLNLINRLRPVTFDWKESKAHDLGLVAEEVAEVEPLLVIHNSEGQVEGVKYDHLNVVLINAIKEQQAQIKSQADAFAALQQENLEMKRRLAALEQSLRQPR